MGEFKDNVIGVLVESMIDDPDMEYWNSVFAPTTINKHIQFGHYSDFCISGRITNRWIDGGYGHFDIKGTHIRGSSEFTSNIFFNLIIRTHDMYQKLISVENDSTGCYLDASNPIETLVHIDLSLKETKEIHQKLFDIWQMRSI